MKFLSAADAERSGLTACSSFAVGAGGEYDDEYRIPVVIGVGRVTMHPRKGQDGGFTPVTLMMEALKIALDDSGVDHDSIISQIDSMGMPSFNPAGETNNPPWLLAKKLGIELPRGRDCHAGHGSSGQLYMGQFCEEIAQGVETGVCLVAQGEARHSLRQARKADGSTTLPHDEDAPKVRGPPVAAKRP